MLRECALVRVGQIWTLSFLVVKAKGNLRSYEGHRVGAKQNFRRSPGTKGRKRFLLMVFTKGAPPRAVDRALHSVLRSSHGPFAKTPFHVDYGGRSRPEVTAQI